MGGLLCQSGDIAELSISFHQMPLCRLYIVDPLANLLILVLITKPSFPSRAFYFSFRVDWRSKRTTSLIQQPFLISLSFGKEERTRPMSKVINYSEDSFVLAIST